MAESAPLFNIKGVKGESYRNARINSSNQLLLDRVVTSAVTSEETVTTINAGTLATIAGGLTPAQQTVFDAQKVKVEQLDTKVGTVEAALPTLVKKTDMDAGMLVATGSTHVSPTPVASDTAGGRVPLLALLVRGSGTALVNGEPLYDGTYVLAWTSGRWAPLASRPSGGNAPDPAKTQVTPARPTFTPNTLTGGGTWSTPTQTGVTYSPASGTATATQTVTVSVAPASSSYELVVNDRVVPSHSWTYAFPDATPKTVADFPSARIVDTFGTLATFPDAAMSNRFYYVQNDSSTGGADVFHQRTVEKGGLKYLPRNRETSDYRILNGKASIIIDDIRNGTQPARLNAGAASCRVEAAMEFRLSSGFGQLGVALSDNINAGQATGVYLRVFPVENRFGVYHGAGGGNLIGAQVSNVKLYADWGLSYKSSTNEIIVTEDGVVRATLTSPTTYTGTVVSFHGAPVATANESTSIRIDNFRVTDL